MRKFFLYLLAAFMLTSCDNLKKKDKTDSEDDTEETTTKKKKKPLDEDEEAADEETPKKKKKTYDDDETPSDEETVSDDDTDNNSGWTGSERTKFLKQCVSDAAENVGEARAREYCNCFLKKVEKKYSSYTSADKNMSETELNKWAGECNK